MTKKTDTAAKELNSIQKPAAFSVVDVAYSVASIMSGGHSRSCSTDGSVDGEGRRSNEAYECMGRISKIPIVEATALAMLNYYLRVKQSHCTVQTVFENVEEGWSKGVEIVSPVTNKIEKTLERPLKAIDNAACVGLDFVEEKIPSVKLPPDELYEKSKEYMNRNVLEPAVHFTCRLLENVRDQVSQFAKTGDADDKADTGNISKTDEVSKSQK
ncbi:lipid storage droplets surface-binding protein 1-like isoform X3 [Diprion similis]|uniref:lipid storage droplets surface-binding protein 1-like isoform X2 n=1 Tax=Diprion similis TaxID=362088 RepID=UPI001EF7FB63|nr:lipid storage droplets surface-binding protein 1-like isoform X2 [Diprion similis]XP_046748206.1 lipid storage droplets surface-binding protein 1-like isoform X3 [Diprion similis]